MDGCKLPSNASKKWSGTLPELRRKKEKIEKKVEQLLAEQVEADKREGNKDGECDFSEISNRAKQIEKLKKKAERIDKWLKDNRAKMGKEGEELKSNITDNDSAKMKTSHGVIQGYNGQALVDSKNQMIIHAEAFGNGQDHDHFEPMLDGAKENMGATGHSDDYFAYKILTADTNYHSLPTLNRCKGECIDAYIPDRDFRKRDPRFTTQQRYKPKEDKKFTLEDFKYNKATDVYICPWAKTLRLKEKKKVVGGIIYRQYSADGKDCDSCVLRLRCLRGNKVKRRNLMVPLYPAPGNLSKAMADKVDTEKGRKIYQQRVAIVEPVFASLRFL